jgi:phosphate transport system substrate-binding protein
MKTFVSSLFSNRRNKYAKIRKTGLSKIVFVMALMCSITTFGKDNGDAKTITVLGDEFVSSLIERWISEYAKINPELVIRLENNPNQDTRADLKIITHSAEQQKIDKNTSLVRIGRYAILPIINEKNQLFSKELKKGIKQKELKSIFFIPDNEYNEETEPLKQPEYTVYTKMPESVSANVISGFLGIPADNLQGIFVTGPDKYLISSVLSDTTSVSYSNLSLIYDLNKRTPVSGVKILPIDLNNNGRLDNEEQIYENLDDIITQLESSKKTLIPTGYFSFLVEKQLLSPDLSSFVNWVKEFGQKYNHQYGFLNDSETNFVLSNK